ncbi:MAG: L-ribulose-5-phosphate 4-epimerase, partial [Acidobacteria bacterium]|nr:L-ribulose-5-phosphate 4-epimerase [Acidobacteriota bacterium]
TLTWGNVSGISRADRRVVIKPSGVEYESMALDDMVVLDMEGRVIYGRLRPSSDTPAHLELYRAFPAIGSIVHMHSQYATMFAQACREIPIERFAGLDPLATPGVVVAGHAPFVWGKNCADAIRNGFILEKIAELALGTLQLNPGASPLPAHIQNKHYQRKHGPDAYYGQKR